MKSAPRSNRRRFLRGFVLTVAGLVAAVTDLVPTGPVGGCTATMHPLAGFPALDAVSSSPVVVDQRGMARTDGFPDIGAVEAGPVLTVLNTDDSGAGSLRQAIDDASPGTRIYFDPGVFSVGTSSSTSPGLASPESPSM